MPLLKKLLALAEPTSEEEDDEDNQVAEQGNVVAPLSVLAPIEVLNLDAQALFLELFINVAAVIVTFSVIIADHRRNVIYNSQAGLS